MKNVDLDKMTIVIPFLNEEEEVKNTIENIRKWVGDDVNIIVVNDCSDDEYDYESDLANLNVVYYANTKRLGAARSKDFGISKVKTPYFLLLDAHMRFYDESWLNILIETLDENDRQILCCQTKVLRKSGNRVFESKEEQDIRPKYGTFINFELVPKILEPQWNFVEQSPDSATQIIPCIYGAAYCASKRYWDYLCGYQGLLGFGLEEPYISIKAYMEGGCCRLMKNIVAGHIYRNKFPYRVNGLEYVYNKFLIAELFLPEKMKQYIYDYNQMILGVQYMDVCNLFEEQISVIERLKRCYETILSHSFEDMYGFNKLWADLFCRS